MKLTRERIILTESELFKAVDKKRKLDLTFLSTEVKPNEVAIPLRNIAERQMPLASSILQAVRNKQIVLNYVKGNKSSIVFMPLYSDSTGRIEKVSVNVSKFAKSTQLVDPNTGDLSNAINIQYETLYDLLFGAFCILKSDKLLMDPKLTKFLRTIHIDITQQLLNRSFGNPIFGDKFRFVLGYFFHNGEIDALQLADVMNYDAGKAKVLISSNNEFFNKKVITIYDLMDIIKIEFPNMKNIDVSKLIATAITLLGDSSYYIVDSLAYFVGVVAVKCRRNRDVFNGSLLRSIEKDRNIILSMLLQNASSSL